MNPSSLYWIGVFLSAGISYATWKSIGWAFVHGILSWIYVVHRIEIKYDLF